MNTAAFAIHSQVHAARPDVQAAAHTHSKAGRAFSTLGRLLDGEATLVTSGLDVQYSHRNRVERKSVSVDSGAVVLVAGEDGTRTSVTVTTRSAADDSLGGTAFYLGRAELE